MRYWIASTLFREAWSDDQSTTATTVPSPTTTLEPYVAFDPAKDYLTASINNCVVSESKPRDMYELVMLFSEKVKTNCKLENEVKELEDGSSSCRLKLKVTDENAYLTYVDCLKLPELEQINYKGINYPLSFDAEPVSGISPSPLTSKQLRLRMENGVDDSITDDNSLVKVATNVVFDDLRKDFVRGIGTLDNLVNEVQKMINSDQPATKRMADVIAINRDESSGLANLVLRPIAKTAADEQSTLVVLQKLVNDTNSGLYSLEGVKKATTTTTTTTPKKTTQTSTTTSSTTVQEEEKKNWPLIGGLVGGIGGAAVVAAGVGGWMFMRKGKSGKESNTLVPDTPNSDIVMTPNTRHGMEGSVLVERTPRIGFNSPTFN